MTNFGLPTDKIAHAGTCAVYTHFMLHVFGWDFLLTLAGIIAISIIKEGIDYKIDGNWCNNDIAANLSGWAIYWLILGFG